MRFRDGQDCSSNRTEFDRDLPPATGPSSMFPEWICGESTLMVSLPESRHRMLSSRCYHPGRRLTASGHGMPDPKKNLPEK